MLEAPGTLVPRRKRRIANERYSTQDRSKQRFAFAGNSARSKEAGTLAVENLC